MLSGCGVGTPCAPPGALCNATTGETARFNGETRIERVRMDCCDPATATAGTCAPTGEWWVELTLEGTARRAEVTRGTLDRGGWTESHNLQLSSRDPSGHWEIRYAEWESADLAECWGDAAEDSTYDECADLYTPTRQTLFPCSSDGLLGERVTIEIYSADSPVPLDCVTWGATLPAPPEDCRDAVEEEVL